MALPTLNLCANQWAINLGYKYRDGVVSCFLSTSYILAFLTYIPNDKERKKDKLKLIKIVINEENQFLKQICCRSWQNQAWANLKQGKGRVQVHLALKPPHVSFLAVWSQINWSLCWPWCQWRSLGLNVFLRICEKKIKTGVRVCGVPERAEPFWGSRSGACSDVLSFLPFIHMVPWPHPGPADPRAGDLQILSHLLCKFSLHPALLPCCFSTHSESMGLL